MNAQEALKEMERGAVVEALTGTTIKLVQFDRDLVVEVSPPRGWGEVHRETTAEFLSIWRNGLFRAAAPTPAVDEQNMTLEQAHAAMLAGKAVEHKAVNGVFFGQGGKVMHDDETDQRAQVPRFLDPTWWTRHHLTGWRVVPRPDAAKDAPKPRLLAFQINNDLAEFCGWERTPGQKIGSWRRPVEGSTIRHDHDYISYAPQYTTDRNALAELIEKLTKPQLEQLCDSLWGPQRDGLWSCAFTHPEKVARAIHAVVCPKEAPKA
jgi:hypothetical protein